MRGLNFSFFFLLVRLGNSLCFDNDPVVYFIMGRVLKVIKERWMGEGGEGAEERMMKIGFFYGGNNCNVETLSDFPTLPLFLSSTLIYRLTYFLTHRNGQPVFSNSTSDL